MSNNDHYVTTTIENGVGTICFSHPKSNSLPQEVLDGLYTHINNLAENPNAKVIVLKSEGVKAFCSGASFDELKAITTPKEGELFFSRLSKVILAIKSAPKFVIARVQGKAVGGGAGLVAACDYSFALESASMKLSELALGLGPFLIGPALERKIGVAKFSYMAIDTDWRSAVWCKDSGLYTEIFHDIDSLDVALSTLTTRLATYNPDAMKQMKHVFWEGTEHWDTLLFNRAAISGTLVLSDFSKKMVSLVGK